MNKNNHVLKVLKNSRLLLVLFSLLTALVMWVYVASQDVEEFKQTFPGVRVELVGTEILRDSRNMVITDLDTNSVTIEVSGPRRLVSSLSSADLVARVDVSKLTQPAYTSQTYTVIFPDGMDASSLKTSNRMPSTLSFMVSAMSKKQIPVRGSFDGKVMQGFKAEQPVYDPATITVYGPEVYLKNVKYAWVTFGENTEIDQSFSAEVVFTLMDENEEECSTKELTFSDNTILASIPIMRVKEVPLDVNVVYGAGATEENTKIVIEPSSILLSGDSAVLDRMNRIVLATIDTTDFSTSFTDTYTIRYEDGIDNLSGVTEAKVTVELLNLVSDKFIVRNISTINVTEGYEDKIITDSITVTLRGPEEQMKAVKAENISAVIDLQDSVNSTGTYTATPKIYVDGFPDVDVILEIPAVTVELQKEEETTP